MKQFLTSEDSVFIEELLGKQYNLIKSSYVDYPWQKRLKYLSFSDFGANRKLHSSIPGRSCLDIYIFRLIKRLWSVGELFSRLRWKEYCKMMIHNHYL